MKIRLIQPTQLDETGRPIKYKKLFLPFLTLPTLAALTPGGIDVAITEDYVEDVNFDEDVDLVGITAQTSQVPRAYQIADAFGKRGTRTIMGGIHASMHPEEALEHCDSVCVGEAENLWEQIVTDAERRSLKKIYRADERPDLSRLGIPRFDLLDFKNYVIPPFARTPLLPIQTTRGCPHQCEFCSVTGFLGHRIRKKPVENVIREIEAMRPSRIMFTDDNIVGDPEHAKELFKALKPLRLRWACQMSTRIMAHPELIDLAAEAGCHETFMGIESLNPSTLKGVHKGFNKPDEYAALFKKLKEVGILAQASMIYGFDEDTPESLRRTADTLLSWDINYLYIFVLTPLPGTAFYARMKADGRLTTADWSQYDVMHPVLKFRNLTPDQLYEGLWDSYERFYSVKEIFKRLWRFRREYVVYFPRDFFLEELVFQFQMRASIKQQQHPFSLGLRKDVS
jgi:radical SAM superfamily enzyme YgiQ (UPF0313 family)